MCVWSNFRAFSILPDVATRKDLFVSFIYLQFKRIFLFPFPPLPVTPVWVFHMTHNSFRKWSRIHKSGGGVGAGWEPRGVFITYIPTQPRAQAAARVGKSSRRPGWRLLLKPQRPGPGDWAAGATGTGGSAAGGAAAASAQPPPPAGASVRGCGRPACGPRGVCAREAERGSPLAGARRPAGELSRAVSSTPRPLTAVGPGGGGRK